MARVLVTGANGFAGRAICRRLRAQGWQVRGSVRSAEAAVADDIEKVVTGDIGADTDWRPALAEVDAVVHCAARVHVLRETAGDPMAAYREVNVAGSRRLAEQAVAAGLRRFVFLSSIGAAVAAAAPARATPYQRSKLEAEAALRAATAGSATRLVMLRPPLVYGPGAPGNFARLLRLIRAGRPLPLGCVDNRRSVLFIGNLADAVAAALQVESAAAEPLALADAEAVSTAELARRIGRACGRPARLLPVPVFLLRLAGTLAGRGATVDALTGDLTIDNAAIQEALGWAPPFTLDQGLAETCAAEAAR
ncbi:MAG: SDR family oxidoreductase [Kiloniellaceae bacterium]